MENNINSSKISPTAHITAHAWDMLGLSNAKYFVNQNFKFVFNIIRAFGLPYLVNKKNDYVYFMLEPRHRAIEYFMLSKFPYKQVVEFACGLSPRGMTFSENPEFTYIESDLTDMLELKKSKVEKVYKDKKIKRPNHKFIEADLFLDNLSEKISPLLTKDEKTVIITEGLTIYYDMESLKKIFSNIAKLLKKNGGGVYITDIYHEEDMKRNIFNNSVMNLALKFLQIKFYMDIDNSDEGESFFRECGFDYVESINPLLFSKQLGLKTKIPPENGVATIYLAHVF
ncbi:MAG: class I SAM-dependent methyltransferase [Candidatus Sericytochromatia bacterium]|nr:class I SAM-dependent methyltransferase [Candidatus Sericytochromatia bacterium]